MTTDSDIDSDTAAIPLFCGEMPEGGTADPPEQDDDKCGHCREAPCICPWVPANWGPGAHEAYRTYARKQALKQRAKSEQEGAA